MHGIAQLVGRYGEELVAGLKQLLQLGNPRAQASFGVRETALLQASVPAQIQLPLEMMIDECVRMATHRRGRYYTIFSQRDAADGEPAPADGHVCGRAGVRLRL
jgi:hypothetical protein